MIEQKQTGTVILQDGENIQETIKMSLDLDSAKSLMQILSKNLYSDAIGSTIRETASNALDSHRAAGVTDRPIIVTFKNDRNNYEFTVEDFGVGLDHDDVTDVISKYGKSLKKLSANQLGMFGQLGRLQK
jgi:HSP90 family molecular chaperone